MEDASDTRLEVMNILFGMFVSGFESLLLELRVIRTSDVANKYTSLPTLKQLTQGLKHLKRARKLWETPIGPGDPERMMSRDARATAGLEEFQRSIRSFKRAYVVPGEPERDQESLVKAAIKRYEQKLEENE
ncbi:hypothetical protein MNV49_007252 [Pseudohyphozyma bogoriensis]|nr:hypothetical protein MNV49_007252 [Pseudohyphozyma bogoriensis]